MKPPFFFRLFFLLALSLVGLPAFREQQGIAIDKMEAQKAFVLLNDIRLHPATYAQALQLHGASVRQTQLIWNDTLAAVAERKAADMATRHYFGHVDPDGYGINYYLNQAGYTLNPQWLSDKRANYFESITAGEADGVTAIETLVLDKDNPSKAHRDHLLGLSAWNASLTDIGIGFVRSAPGSAFPTYMSVVIAKHHW